MAFGNVSELVTVLEAISPILAERAGQLIILLQALGVALILYIVYLIISLVLSFRRVKRLRFIEGKLDNLEKKLDKVLRKKK